MPARHPDAPHPAEDSRTAAPSGRIEGQAKAGFRQSAAFQRLLLNSTAEGFYSVDREGVTTLCNSSFVRMLGFASEDEAIGRKLHDAIHHSHVDGSPYPRVECPIYKTAQSGEPAHVEHELFFRVDGSSFPVEYRVHPIFSDGTLQGAICTFTDITERVKAQRALRDADRRKDEFLATLAHELRNPLAPLRNSLEILRHVGSDPVASGKARAVMERQVRQLSRLVDDLLDISRITSGKIELRKQYVDLGDLVASAVEGSQPLMKSHRHRLSINLPQRPISLEADPARLAQTMINLLDNAAKYTPPGGEIVLSADALDDQAVISVRDNGIGISAESLDKVFELFMQVDASAERSHGGLGIGLTLVKRLVELHGGSVTVHSAGAGAGSEFIVKLPLAEKTHGVLGAAAAGAAASHTSEMRRILVVDDNVDAATSLKMLLELMGHEVRLAHDGASALATAAAEPPDVIFLDIGMPGMTGYDVARSVRGELGLVGTFVVALSGYGTSLDRRRSLEAGFDEHAVKPIEPEQIEALLADARSFRRSRLSLDGGEVAGIT